MLLFLFEESYNFPDEVICARKIIWLCAFILYLMTLLGCVEWIATFRRKKICSITFRNAFSFGIQLSLVVVKYYNIENICALLFSHSNLFWVHWWKIIQTHTHTHTDIPWIVKFKTLLKMLLNIYMCDFSFGRPHSVFWFLFCHTST